MREAGLYSDEELAFSVRVREFCETEIAPLAARDAIPSDDMRQAYSRLARAGFVGLHVPKTGGGVELGYLMDALVSMELAAISPAMAACRGICSTFYSVPIARFGSAPQWERYLRPVLAGDALAALAITEPGAGSDAASMKTTCTRLRDGSLSLSGTKHLISNSAVADFFLVYAVGDVEAGARSMVACVVPRDAQGFSMEPMTTMGLDDLGHAILRFEDCVLDPDALIGAPGQGFTILMDQLVSERVDIAARAFGQARAAWRAAVEHTSTREQFGRPIREFEGVSFQVAEMHADLSAMEMLVVHAARRADAGDEATLEAATAKLFAAQRGFEICDKALQLCGGLAFAPSSAVGRAWRDTRTLRYGGGTDEIMKFVIQREVYRQAAGTRGRSASRHALR